MESAHYPKLDTRIAGDGQSRIELFNEGKRVDTIYIYRYDIEAIRDLMTDLGLNRDESITWEKRQKEAELASYFNSKPAAAKKDEL